MPLWTHQFHVHVSNNRPLRKKAYDNNFYLGTLFQLDKDASTQDVQVGKGDELLGDTLRSTLAEVTAQVCEGDFARDMDFAVVNVKGESPPVEAVQERLGALSL